MANFKKNPKSFKPPHGRNRHKRTSTFYPAKLDRKEKTKHSNFSPKEGFLLFFFPIALTELIRTWDRFKFDHRHKSLMHVHIYPKFFVWNFDGRFVCSLEQFAAMSALAFKKRGMTDRMQREMLKHGQTSVSMKAQKICLFESFSAGPFLRYLYQNLNSVVDVCFAALEKPVLQSSVVENRLKGKKSDKKNSYIRSVKKKL
jgi:hypothetical protein